MRKLWLLTLAAGLSGCAASGNPVYIQANLARLDLPEAPSRTVRLAGGFYDKSAFVVLTPDQVATPPSATKTQVTASTPPAARGNEQPDEKLWGRGDFTFGKRLSLGVSAPRYAGPTMYRAKLFLGDTPRDRARSGTTSAALTAAYGRDHRGLDAFGGYSTQIERDVRDFSLVLGVRINRVTLLYLGPYWQRTHYSFVHKRPGTPDSAGNGDVTAEGGHLGLAFYAGRFSSFVAEWSRARIDAPGDRATLGTGSLIYQLDF